jgi:uncharacterized integral membrane protein
MSGRHQSDTQSRAVSMRKSAVWLLQLAGALTAILILLAGTALVGYVLVVHPGWAWPVPLAVALGSMIGIGVLGQVILSVMDSRPLPRPERARLVRSAALSLSSGVVVFVAVGRLYGWSHGVAHDGLLWAGSLCLGGCGAYGLAKDHRVVIALKARAARMLRNP